MFDSTGKSNTELVLIGHMTINTISDASKAEHWAFILHGHYDLPLAHAFYQTAFGKVAPEGVDPSTYNEVKKGIENTKQVIRNNIQRALDPVGYARKMQQKEQNLMREFEARERESRRRYREQKEAEERAEKEKRDAFNAQHAPAPEGTVKELAARYGKSLSEIRRLKAAGELHTLTTPV